MAPSSFSRRLSARVRFALVAADLTPFLARAPPLCAPISAICSSLIPSSIQIREKIATEAFESDRKRSASLSSSAGSGKYHADSPENSAGTRVARDLAAAGLRMQETAIIVQRDLASCRARS